MEYVLTGLLLIGTAIIIAHATSQEYLTRAFLLRHGLPAMGVIVALEEQRNEPGTTYYPVVRFTPHAQPELTARCAYPIKPKKVRYDEWLPLRYHPDQPHTFLLTAQGNTRGRLYFKLFGSAVLLSLGVCVLMLGMSKLLTY